VSIEDVTGGHSLNRFRPVANTRTDTRGIVRVTGRGTRTYIVRVWTHEGGGTKEVGRSDVPGFPKANGDRLYLVDTPVDLLISTNHSAVRSV